MIIEDVETPRFFEVTVTWPWLGKARKTIRVEAVDEAEALRCTTELMHKTGPHFAIRPAGKGRESEVRA